MVFQLDLINVLLFLVGVSNLLLAVIILINNRGAAINRLFTLNIICIIGWVVSFALFRNGAPSINLWLHLVYSVATLIASTFLHFSIIFPTEIERPHRTLRITAMYLTNAVVFYLALCTPLFLVSAQKGIGTENPIVFGPLYLFYILYIVGFFGIGIANLLIKYSKLREPLQKRQSLFLLVGYGIASSIALTTNLVLPWYGIFTFDWFGEIFTLCMIAPVAYGILRYRLFETKIILTEVLIFLLMIGLISRVILSQSNTEFLVNIAQLVISLILGGFLIRATTTELNARTRAEDLAAALEIINSQQENLLHFISHEVKGYLAKSEAGFAAITQGDYGAVSPELDHMAQMALEDVRKGVRTVIDILDASNLKKGTVAYRKTVFDLKDTVARMIEHLKKDADEKHLTIETSIAWEVPCKINGDEMKIRDHVVRNLLDNAIKYTPVGSIKVSVAKSGKIVRFIVQDSGVGITEEDKKRLFTEGGHGKDSIKINVHSTGYGLYIAKQIVEAHDGRIWAESDGQGKGSRFIVEFPAA